MSLAFTFGRVYGCASLLVLLLDIYCLLRIAESSSTTVRKAIWAVVVIFFPLGGAILWVLFGRRS